MKKEKQTHLKTGDRIQIISGNNKGLIGNIISLNKNKEIAIVDSVPTRKKFVAKKEKELEIPIKIHFSNLMLWDNLKKEKSRIGYKIINDIKVRYFKKSGNVVEKINENVS